MTTIADALETRLGQLGVGRVYGSPLGKLPHVEVADPDLAVLLADADGRIGHRDGSGRLGAALIDGPILHLSSQPGGTSVLQHVTSAGDLFDLLADPPGMEIPGTLGLELDLDLSQPVTSDDTVSSPVRTPVMTLDPGMSGLRIVLLVGVGVVRAAVVEDVRELARRVGWGVVTTPGARGVERWDSPFDFGTVGLQERDLELSGLLDADVIVTSGVDPDELDMGSLAAKLVQDVPPRQLSALIRDWPVSRRPPERSRHHDVLAGALVPLYESEQVPLTAPRAVLHLAGALPEGGIVIGGPGPSGFWLARSYPTSVPESLCVAATHVRGFVEAAALVCAIEGRPHVGVLDRIDDPITGTVLDMADRMGLELDLQLWGDLHDTGIAASKDHVDLTLRRAHRTGRAHRVESQDPTPSTTDPATVDAPRSVVMSSEASEPHVVQIPVMTRRFDTLSEVMGVPVARGGPESWTGTDDGSAMGGRSR